MDEEEAIALHRLKNPTGILTSEEMREKLGLNDYSEAKADLLKMAIAYAKTPEGAAHWSRVLKVLNTPKSTNKE